MVVGCGSGVVQRIQIKNRNSIPFDLMTEKLKILFVCTINRMRSATAQIIYENDDRFEVYPPRSGYENCILAIL
jgi:hypothetical protein